MVRRPAFDRFHDHAFVGKWPVRRAAFGITEEMRVAGRIRKVVFAIELMHPGTLEKPAVVCRRRGAICRFHPVSARRGALRRKSAYYPLILATLAAQCRLLIMPFAEVGGKRLRHISPNASAATARPRYRRNTCKSARRYR
jgi:hypothetical protein